MVISNKNIFISSSCIFPKDYTIFSPQDRCLHLRSTVESCKRISDSINVISEGSMVSDEIKDIFTDCVFFTYEGDATIEWATQSKQLGTPVLWIAALQNIKVSDDSNIFFLSGRYELTSDFDASLFTGDYVFKKHWFAEGRGGWYGTQLFKISGSKREEFIHILQECLNKLLDGTAQDIECAIYQSLTQQNIQPQELDVLNCQGLLGPTGNLEKH